MEDANWIARLARLLEAPRDPDALTRMGEALQSVGGARRLFEILLGDWQVRGGLQPAEAQWLAELARAWVDLGPAPLLARAVGPRAALRWFAPLCREGQEVLAVAFLDSANHCLGVREIFRGGVAGVTASPREILCSALAAGAARLIVAHNHPSRDPVPSAEDVAFTRRLARCAELVGLDLLDHLILCEGGSYYSFAEQAAPGATLTRRGRAKSGRVSRSFARSRGDPSRSAGNNGARPPACRR